MLTNARQSILIVDDKPQNLFALQQTLAEIDAEVIKASSGNAALAATIDHDFALAILDVQMPDMDGFELAEFLRGDERTRQLPIIFLTAAYGAEDKVFEGYKAGAVDYIIKPYSAPVLLAKTRVFLELDRQRRELMMHYLHQEKLVFARTNDLRTALVDLQQEKDAAQERAKELHELLKDVWVKDRAIESAINSIALIDLDGSISYVNPAFLEMWGHAGRDEVWGKEIRNFFKNPGDVTPIMASLNEHGVWKGEFTARRSDGTDFIASTFASMMSDENGNKLGYQLTCIDVTAQRKVEKRLAELAHSDPLTGLANRAMLNERLVQDINSAKRTGMLLGVLVLDLDRFKLINDTLGHQAGDKLLIECAERLRSTVRSSDIVARIGGDEFVIIGNNLKTVEGAGFLASKILEKMEAPFVLSGKKFSITTSIGIAVYDKDGKTVEELLKNADAAMFRGKEAGRNQFQFYDESIHVRAMQLLELESELKLAVKKQQFVLHYQPQIDGDVITGGEALIRWQHPEKGLLYPDRFISMLAKTGMIMDIEKWTIQSTLSRMKQLRNGNDRKFTLAVNVSAQTLQDAGFPEWMERQFSVMGLPHDCLELEITEGILLQNVVQTARNLASLKEMGVGIALDDFGTGYSSMGYLLRFPEITTLKIDREFVWKTEESRRNQAILEAIINLGRSLGMKVVAEGVETIKQLRLLNELNCTNFQGYLISPAVPADEWDRQFPSWNENIRKISGRNSCP